MLEMPSQCQKKVKKNFNYSNAGRKNKKPSVLFDKETNSSINSEKIEIASIEKIFSSEDFPLLKLQTCKTRVKKQTKTDKQINLEISNCHASSSNEEWKKPIVQEQSPQTPKATLGKNPNILASNDTSSSKKLESTVSELLSNQLPVNRQLKESVSREVLDNNLVPKHQKILPVQSYRNPYKKKRTAPLLISLEDGLQNNRRHASEKVKTIKGKFHRTLFKDRLSGNLLDASNPKRNKGKHREIKKKQLSSLKSLIIKERIMKKTYRQNLDSFPAGYVKEFSQIAETIDFKTEVEKYLREPKKIKGRKLKETKGNLNGNDLATGDDFCEDKSKAVQSDVKIQLKTSSSLNKKPQIISQATDAKHSHSDKTIFSAKMREYCDNIVTPDLNSAVLELIKGLVNFQDRAYFRDPIKAKARKRHVSGLKETKKYLTLKKVKMIIFPPDLEKLLMQGSINDLINELKILSENQNVPFVFALNRYHLGQCTKKFVPVSAFAILNYDGLEIQYEKVLNHLKDAKEKFREKICKLNESESETKQINAQITSNIIDAFEKKISFTGDNTDNHTQIIHTSDNTDVSNEIEKENENEKEKMNKLKQSESLLPKNDR